MKKFENLTKDELWSLRQQITLNSHYFADYENKFGFDSHSVCAFFDGYYDYIWELAEEQNEEVTDEIVVKYYDNIGNLWRWYNCYDDFSWIKYND